MDTSKEKKIYTIKEIKKFSRDISETNYHDLEGAALSAIFAGMFALINGPIAINGVPFVDLSKYPVIMNGAIGISCACSAFYIGICIREKIKNVLKINELRNESGITKEEQKKFLEELLKEGNQEAIELFDYFYGKEKRKSL